MIGLVAAFFAAYLALALGCLVQWGASDPWSRVGLFPGGFFAAGPLWIAEYLYFLSAIGRSKEVRDEASGATFDRASLTWFAILPIIELAAFLDYGHWRLTPALEQPLLQGLGLGLWVVSPLWLVWADVHLGRHFAREPAARRPIQDGPFRWVRHPRYLGLLVSRAAFALVFASAIAWVLFGAWGWVVRRRIRREEQHLLATFGDAYASYAAGTGGLVPWRVRS